MRTRSRRHWRIPSVGAALCCMLGLALPACFYQFNRLPDQSRGEITGVATRADRNGAPAPFARIDGVGTSLIRRANISGTFTLGGLEPGPWVLRISDDVDGDGQPERSRLLSVRVRSAPLATGLFGSQDGVTSVVLGAVGLDGTTTVSGKVLVGDAQAVPSEQDLVVRVIVTRDIEIPGAEAGTVDPFSLGAERATTVDSSGRFQFNDVETGPFNLIAMVFGPVNGVNALGPLLHVTEPLLLEAFADQTVELPAVIQVPDLTAAPTLTDVRPVDIFFVPAQPQVPYLLVGAQGAAFPPCETQSPAVPYSGIFAGIHVVTSPEANSSSISQVRYNDFPVGLWDVKVCQGNTASGVLAAQLAGPMLDSATDVAPFWGPVFVTTTAECEESGVRDCDGDGVQGLPPFSPAVAEKWQACVTTCASLTGPALASVSCQIDGDPTVYDCDDDGDGQPDVTEAPDCYGPHHGTDFDGDRICSGQDPFPQCAANTAEACEAGTYDVNLSPPPQYSSPNADVLDAAFGDGGAVLLPRAFEGDDVAKDVLVLEDGSYLVVGSSTSFDGTSDGAIWHVLADGNLDTSFGSLGTGLILLDSFDGVAQDEEARAVAVSDAGQVVVVGVRYLEPDNTIGRPRQSIMIGWGLPLIEPSGAENFFAEDEFGPSGLPTPTEANDVLYVPGQEPGSGRMIVVGASRTTQSSSLAAWAFDGSFTLLDTDWTLSTGPRLYGNHPGQASDPFSLFGAFGQTEVFAPSSRELFVVGAAAEQGGGRNNAIWQLDADTGNERRPVFVDVDLRIDVLSSATLDRGELLLTGTTNIESTTLNVAFYRYPFNDANPSLIPSAITAPLNEFGRDIVYDAEQGVVVMAGVRDRSSLATRGAGEDAAVWALNRDGTPLGEDALLFVEFGTAGRHPVPTATSTSATDGGQAVPSLDAGNPRPRVDAGGTVGESVDGGFAGASDAGPGALTLDGGKGLDAGAAAGTAGFDAGPSGKGYVGPESDVMNRAVLDGQGQVVLVGHSSDGNSSAAVVWRMNRVVGNGPPAELPPTNSGTATDSSGQTDGGTSQP